MDDYEILNRTNSTCECSVRYELPGKEIYADCFGTLVRYSLTVEGEPN